MKQRRACDGKRRFGTLGEAQRAAAEMVARKDRQGLTIVTWLRAYGCRCGGFHFGRTRQINWDVIRRGGLTTMPGASKPA